MVKLSQRGAQFIAQFEGFQQGITRAQAYKLLRKDAREIEKAIHRLGIPLKQHQFDALVSFTFHAGAGWMSQKGKLISALRARRYREVAAAMKLWSKAGKSRRLVAGLARRRVAEARLFALGYRATAISASASGKRGRQVVKLAGVQLGKQRKSVLLVQKALRKAVGLGSSSEQGTFGLAARKAYGAGLRKLRFTGAAAAGKSGLKALKVLGEKLRFAVRGGRTQRPAGKRVPSPVPGYKAMYRFGIRSPRGGAGSRMGVGYAAPVGTPVVAVRAGKIVWSKADHRFYGNWIGLQADDNRVYVYGHLSARLVKTGQMVKAGQTIGKIGMTGQATRALLHFEVHSLGAYRRMAYRKPAR